MEHFLAQNGYMPKGTDLNNAINKYCEALKVKEEDKNIMHLIRKNR